MARQKQLSSTAPKIDAGPFPCKCAEKGDYCMLDSMGGDPDRMWKGYHCVLRVRGVVYKRDEDGEIQHHAGGKPSRQPIKANY